MKATASSTSLQELCHCHLINATDVVAEFQRAVNEETAATAAAI